MIKLGSNLLLIAGIFLAGCTHDRGKQSLKPTADGRRTELPAPFHFARSLEIKPGLTFDVVSWGRGSDNGGSWMILRSDSTHLKYRTLSGDLDGRVTDAWNMDLDADGNPEVFIEAKGRGEGSYLTMYIYEFNSAGEGQKIRFPDLTQATIKMYRGMDSLYIKDGKLRREFPLFEEGDNTSSASGGKKVVEYTLRNNSLDVSVITDPSADQNR